MDTRLPFAQRIEHGLRRHLGTYIDIELMLRSGLYARDVLIVCDMITGSDLPDLARQYRAAGAEAAWAALRAAARDAVDVPCSEGSGPVQYAAPQVAEPQSGGNWLAPARWFGR